MKNDKKNVNDVEVESKDDILKRLRRIEGQVKGIQRMIEDDKKCSDILTQVAAVRSAVNKVGSIILEKHSLICLENAVSNEDKKLTIEDLTKTIQSFIKFID